jgi:hypothetical protein
MRIDVLRLLVQCNWRDSGYLNGLAGGEVSARSWPVSKRTQAARQERPKAD